MRIMFASILLAIATTACLDDGAPPPQTSTTADEVTQLPLCSLYGCLLPSGSPDLYTECTNNDCWCRLPDYSLIGAAICGHTINCQAECRLTGGGGTGSGNPPTYPLDDGGSATP